MPPPLQRLRQLGAVPYHMYTHRHYSAYHPTNPTIETHLLTIPNVRLLWWLLIPLHHLFILLPPLP